jgi:Flp pilus assembly protein TadG
MKTPFFRRLFRFRRDEEGGIFLVEFCILVPILFGAFMMAVEMGLYSMRQMYLDRGVDIAVRYIRLSTTHRSRTTRSSRSSAPMRASSRIATARCGWK